MRFKEIQEGTRCWKGYEKKGMKTMFGKRVPNCVKREGIGEQDIAQPTAMSQRAQSLAGDIATSFKKLGDQPFLYYKGYKDFMQARKAKQKKQADQAKKNLEKVAAKMTPAEKAATEKEIDKRNKQTANQPAKPWWMN